MKSMILFLAMALSMWAQADPAKREEAAEERMKVLRAADMIDSIQQESEQLRTEVNGFKDQIAALKAQSEAQTAQNEKLRADLITLRTALEKAESMRVQEREALLKEIGALISEKLKTVEAAKPEPEKPSKPVVEKPKPKPEVKEEGYTHVVEHGQTLSAIAQAYRENGVNVTINDIRKANGIKKTDVIKSGQKLFIPKK